MSNLFEQLNEMYTNRKIALVPDAEAKLTQYLTGQLPQKDVQELFPQLTLLNYYDRLSVEPAITKLREAGRLVEFGRFMQLAHYIFGQEIFMVFDGLYRALSAEEVLHKLELPDDLLIMCLFARFNFVYEDRKNTLEALCHALPSRESALQVFLKNAKINTHAIANLAMVKAKADKTGNYRKNLLENLAVCMAVFGNDYDSKKVVPFKLSFPELDKMMAAELGKNWLANAIESADSWLAQAKYVSDVENSAYSAMACAVCAFAIADPLVNLLFGQSAALNPVGAYDNLLPAFANFYMNTNTHTTASVKNEAVQLIGQKNALHLEYFMIYLANRCYYSGANRQAYYNFVAEHPQLLPIAIQNADFSDAAILSRSLWEKGEGLETIPYFIEKAAQAMVTNTRWDKIPEADKPKVIAFITGKIPYSKDIPQTGWADNTTVMAVFTALYDRPEAKPFYTRLACNCAEAASYIHSLFYRMNYLYGTPYSETVAVLANQVGIQAALSCMVEYNAINPYPYLSREIKAATGAFAAQHLDISATVLQSASGKGKSFLMGVIYNQNPAYRPELLIAGLSDSTKSVRDIAVKYLKPMPEYRLQVEPLTCSKKQPVRESAEKLLMYWDFEANGADIPAAAKKNVSSTTAQKAMEWLAVKTIPEVRLADGTPADPDLPLACLYIYLSAGVIEPQPAAQKVAALLNESDLAAAGKVVLECWLADGADTKKKGAMFFAAMVGKEIVARELKKLIDEWMKSSRGALAADAVRALALSGNNLGLSIVDNLALKAKNKMVMKAAEDAMEAAADALGIEPGELSDRIVPTLGFDESGRQQADAYTVHLLPDLKLELTDANGKTIKTPPAAVKELLSGLKKDIKTVSGIQKERLEVALSSNRRWSREVWEGLFVRNPIMRAFSTGLVWGVYQDDNLTNTFRYLDDGSFNNVNDDEFTLPANAIVALPHPLDLGPELTDTWARQLDDYEIKQPLLQLMRPVYVLEEAEQDMAELERFGGLVINAGKLLYSLTKMGWRKGSIEDGGGYYYFEKLDKPGKLYVNAEFSGTCVGMEPTDEVHLQCVRFFQNEGGQLPLKDVPPRVFSEIVYNLSQATEGCAERKENWK